MLRTTGMKVLNVGMIAVLAAGCGVQAKTYVMDKERVNIQYQGGNAGYITGRPAYNEPEKKTRRVYILELTKPVGESGVKKVKEETVTQVNVSAEQVPAYQQTAHSQPGPLVIAPSAPQETAHYEDETYASLSENSAPSGPADAVSYTVVKDDTLQKIAKKFYDSYGKWIKIYEANKEKIKNPNFVKPGTVLTIPPADDKK